MPDFRVESADHTLTYIGQYKDQRYKREYHSNTGVLLWWKAHFYNESRQFADFQHGWEFVDTRQFTELEMAFQEWRKNIDKDEG